MQVAMRGNQRAGPRVCTQTSGCTVICPGLKLPATNAAQR